MILTFFFLDARTLPVFSTPPSILFVDLDLAPGETKKCKKKQVGVSFS